MCSCYWFRFAGFAVATYLISISASAIMVKPGTASAETNSSTQEQDRSISTGSIKSGVISAVDVGRNIIVIGGSTYMFVPALTKVHSSNPHVNGNPLKLVPGQSVQFLSTEETGSRQRVTEVIVK